MGGAKFCRFALFPLMLLMLLLLPTRMVAQTDYAYAEFNNSTRTLTFKCGPSKPEGAYGLNEETSNPGWIGQSSNIEKVVFDASFANARPTSCHMWFYQCTNLTDIEGIENLNTEKVTAMSGMFFLCEKLSSLDLSNFNTEKVTNMYGMFFQCAKLTSLDLSNFNTEKVTIMDGMFCNCSSLTSLDLSNFNTEKVEDMYGMFSSCSALTTIYASDKFVTDLVSEGSEMFLGCKNLKGYAESKIDKTYANCGTDGYFTPGCGYAEFDNVTGTLTFRYKGVKPAGAYGLNEGTSDPGWIGQSSNIEKVVFDASFANARPTNCYDWFYNCQKLTDIKGIENLNTEKVTNMSWMFCACSALTSLDLSNFNTEKVTNMNGMFCNCPALTSLDLSNFNTEKVTNMYNMFSSCPALTSLDLSNFNTEKVTTMNCMFRNCSALTSLDLSNFNTENVTDMGGMFESCSALTSLDLSNFNTEKVTDMNGMFSGCSALTTIYASDKFVTGQFSDGVEMFYGCKNLKGYADSKIDHTYANYKTGYFSKLVGKNGEEKIGATGETLATDNLVLADGKDFVAYEQFAAKNASYIRDIPEGSTWGTLCLPFAIVQSQETECKFYRLTGIDKDCITLESCEEGKIPAGTPVLFKMNEGVQKLEISVQDADLVKEPVAGTNKDVNLVGSFTKIGGNDNQGLAENDYIIGKDKFWLVSELKDGKGVGIKPMRAYIHPATTSQARAAMLSIGKGDGTTAIDNLNAISNDANAEYYDANGRRTNGLQKGLNIVKRGSKTYKIMVK